MSDQPDKDCKTLENGECVAKDCMHNVPQAVKGNPGHHEKPWGMSREDFAKFMSLVCMGLERADNRQRYLFKKVLKPIIRELRIRYPHGRPIEDIKKEIAEHEQKIKLIIPQGINPESLKGEQK